MTAAAVKPQATATPAPVKALAAPAAKSPPRPKPVPLTPMRREAAGLMRKLATSVQQSHPDMGVHDHLRDAAKQTEKGNEEAAQRHLRAAMFSLTPQSLMRNGQHTDDSHQAARAAMHGIHRHLLLVKDIADVSARNQAVIRKDSGDGAAVPPPRPDPNAGYGPGANAQKPAVRQPPGDQALNAPAKADGGGSDPAVAGPDAPQRPGSKQFTARGEAGAVLDLVGPGGFQHGWKPGGPTAADHDKAARLHTRAAAKAKDPAVKAMHVRRAKVHTQVARKLRSLSDPGLAYGWDDLGTLIELSAKTAALEVTPAPRGKPGGPGLYKAKGNMHSPYMQNVVKALIEKRGMDPGKAYAIAWGAMRKWSKGGGKVTPEVRAAAAGGLGLEKAAEARAHAHANRHGRVIDLDWTAWDAGERGDASAKAHDTASATASRTAKAKIAADKLHAVAGDADKKFPSASAGKDIHAAADSFSKGDAEGAHQHLQDARMKVRGATEAKGKIVGRDPIANDQNDLDSILRTGQGQAQMMAQQQDDDAKAAAKAAKKAAKAQQHAVTWDDVLLVVELAAAPPPANSGQARVPAGSAGGGEFGSGGGQPAAGQKSLSSQTASKNVKAKIAQSQQAKAGLLKQAAGYRAKADALIAQRKALQAQLASASGATSSGQSGSTTSSGASTTSSGASTTASTAPAAGTTAAATTPAAAASTTTTPAASTTALSAAQTAQIKVQVAQMTTQIIALQGQYKQAMAAAAKL